MDTQLLNSHILNVDDLVVLVFRVRILNMRVLDV